MNRATEITRFDIMREEISRRDAAIKRLLAALKEIEDFPHVGVQASQRIASIARAARLGAAGEEGGGADNKITANHHILTG